MECETPRDGERGGGRWEGYMLRAPAATLGGQGWGERIDAREFRARDREHRHLFWNAEDEGSRDLMEVRDRVDGGTSGMGVGRAGWVHAVHRALCEHASEYFKNIAMIPAKYRLRRLGNLSVSSIFYGAISVSMTQSLLTRYSTQEGLLTRFRGCFPSF